jgi:hypothetical protein
VNGQDTSASRDIGDGRIGWIYRMGGIQGMDEVKG